MSATAVTAISLLTGIALQVLRTREELYQAALAAGEITAEAFAGQDAELAALVQRLKVLAPPAGGTP